MTPLLCPPNSLSCIDSVSLGRAGVSEKVNSGWPSRLGQSGIRAEILWFGEPPCSEISAGPTSKGGRGDHLCQEFCPLASGLHSWPRRSWLNIMDRFPLLSSENQDSNLMLPPLNLWQGSRRSKLITTQTLSHPPVSAWRGAAAQEALIETSTQSLTYMSKKRHSPNMCAFSFVTEN